MNRTILVLLLLLASLAPVPAQQEAPRRALSVAVIAPSVSTSMEARRLIAQQKWTVGKFKTADAILVVVRSALFNPLQANYRFIGELSKDADNQLNIAGPKFHIE